MAVSYTHLDVYKRQSVSNVKYGMTTVTDGTMKNVNYESGQNGYFYETKLGDIFLFSERENEDSTGKIKSFCLTNDNVYFVKVDAPEEFAKRYDYIDAYESVSYTHLFAEDTVFINDNFENSNSDNWWDNTGPVSYTHLTMRRLHSRRNYMRRK